MNFMETVIEMHDVSRLREEVFVLQISFHKLKGNVLFTVWSEVIGIRGNIGSVNQAYKLYPWEVLLASLRAAFTIDIGLSGIGTHLEESDFGLDDITHQLIVNSVDE